MSHLTRIRLNPARARRLTAAPQRLHAAVAAAFPPPPADENPTHRVLWRLDETTVPHRQETLLIVSSTPPDLTHVVEQVGWPALATIESPGWETRPYSPALQRLTPGMLLRFRLTANPTRSTSRPGQRGQRTSHTTTTHQLRWLLDRAAKAGFSIPVQPHLSNPQAPEHHQVSVLATRRLDFARQPGDRSRVQLTAVTYEGHLEVTEPDLLSHTLTHGIGHGKAYGCGLMTIAPQQPR
ncbi:type I-E CRISPR-associated protein Cas6/Cse3/CasE [Streptomyces sp. NPDC056056]|uniref:type I-E CRISPR-associated protein Cas6/Cse3/CasE n=1 Tax=Streptomyces sp. NPDC056056 TaxID=3345698 RepID=UPI0035DECDD4